MEFCTNDVMLCDIAGSGEGGGAAEGAISRGVPNGVISYG